jgi:hypothetical protein
LRRVVWETPRISAASAVFTYSDSFFISFACLHVACSRNVKVYQSLHSFHSCHVLQMASPSFDCRRGLAMIHTPGRETRWRHTTDYLPRPACCLP